FLITLLPAIGLWRLQVDTDGAAVYPEGDRTVERTRADRRAFHDVDQLIVLVTARSGGKPVESVQGLGYLRELHQSLEELDGVWKNRLRSLASLPDARPGTSLLMVKPFLEEIPDSEEKRLALLGRIRASDLAQGLFLSRDGRAAAIYVPVSHKQDREQLLERIEEWAARHRNADFDLQLSGPVVAEVTLGRAVLRDLAWLVPLMVAAIAVLLFAGLGSLAAVVATMAEILLVLVWTLGAMGLAGVPITLVTTILPVLLMAISVTDEVHLLDRFRHYLAAQERQGIGRGGQRRRHALERAFRDVSRPLILTSLTTSIAFLSFLSASMAPLRHFGLFASLGVLLAMLLSFTLVPALLLLLPGAWFRHGRTQPSAAVPALERFLVRQRRRVALLGLLVVLISLPGFLMLHIQDSWIGNFDPHSDLVMAEKEFNRHFWGAYRFDVVLTSPQKGFFQQAEGLRLLERLRPVVRQGPQVGGAVSSLEAFEKLAEILQQESPVSTLPPHTISRMARLLSLITTRLDLDHYLRHDGTSARLRLFVNNPDYQRGKALQEYLDRKLGQILQGSGLQYHFSGDLPVAGAVVRAIVANMLQSVAWTLAGVALLLAVLWGSPIRAAAAMAPLVAGSALLVGLLGYAEVPLGIATSMFIAVTIGVAVDFSLHFTHAYESKRQCGLASGSALEGAWNLSGRAIRWNAIVLSLGFLVLSLSALKPNRSLGFLLAAAMAACYLATLVFLPWILEKLPEWPVRTEPSRSSAPPRTSLKHVVRPKNGA
ncbi:MAG: MMPL family transporter, partial [Acidobacteriota bacterium]